MTDIIRWGILGLGSIAHAFADALRYLPDARLVAVGSRAAESAALFGAQYDVPRRYDSYEALAADPEVEMVYVATPHHLHEANTRLCLEAGKGVLCEKPFAINADEAARMIALARQKGRFLMEAMWSRFLPAMTRVRELVAEGALGEVRLVQANFGFHAPFDPSSRLFNPALGGGTLLDIGIYPVSFAVMLLGLPDAVSSQAHLGATGVDEQAGIVLRYADRRLAVLHTSFQVTTSNEAEIVGTAGRLRVHPRFHQAEALTLYRPGEPELSIEAPIVGNGYRYEAEEVHRCLRAGKLESDLMPLDETLAIMHLLDQIRAQWGLRYPME
jgi:predicted dehydrogenase